MTPMTRMNGKGNGRGIAEDAERREKKQRQSNRG